MAARSVSHCFFQVTLWTLKSWMVIYLYMIWIDCYKASVIGHQVIGSSHHVLAKVGEDVIFPCHIEPPVNMLDQTVKWTRPDLEPEYVHLLQDGHDVFSYTNPLYKNRTSLFHDGLSHGNISLKLYRVRLSDEGKYSCSVITLDVQTMHSSSLIQLLVAQQDVIYIPPKEGVLRLLQDTSSVAKPITSILWKHGPNKAAEWDPGFGPDVEYYRTFKNRAELDKETGQLVINNMNIEDDGEYSVEINGRPLYKTYMVKQMKKVTKPLVATKVPCDSNSTSCEVDCILHGDIKEYGLVTYLWKKDEGEWMVSDSGPNSNRLIVTKDEDRKVKTLTCEVKNEFSMEWSDPQPNYLHHEGPLLRTSTQTTGGIVGSFFVLIAAVVLVTVGVIYRDRIRKMFKDDNVQNEHQPTKDENNQLLKQQPPMGPRQSPLSMEQQPTGPGQSYLSMEQPPMCPGQRPRGSITLPEGSDDSGGDMQAEATLPSDSSGSEEMTVTTEHQPTKDENNQLLKQQPPMSPLSMEQQPTGPGQSYLSMEQPPMCPGQRPNIHSLTSDSNTASRTTERLKEEDAVCDDQYQLTSKPAGLCVIMNNKIFPSSQPRTGTNEDAVDLARTFSWLGFRVLMFKDQTKIQMEEMLKLLSSLEDPARLRMYGKVWEWFRDEFTDFNINADNPLLHGDAFVCCIMSHGDKGGLFGTDGERLSIDDITATFSGVKCPLLEKPKVFFIQAVQLERKSQPEGQVDNSAGGDAMPFCMTEETDFLVAMATVENHEAKRHPINGTCFMQCLCKRLRKHCPSGADLMTILCKINHETQNGAPEEELMPKLTCSTLRTKLVFTPISN